MPQLLPSTVRCLDLRDPRSFKLASVGTLDPALGKFRKLARRHALDHALRRAVEHAVGIHLLSHSSLCAHSDAVHACLVEHIRMPSRPRPAYTRLVKTGLPKLLWRQGFSQANNYSDDSSAAQRSCLEFSLMWMSEKLGKLTATGLRECSGSVS